MSSPDPPTPPDAEADDRRLDTVPADHDPDDDRAVADPRPAPEQ